MCGFTGYISFEDKDNRRLVHRMRYAASLLQHRGPDQYGEFIETAESVGMAFARLSIIDLSPNASQPMRNEDGNLLLMVNGEIYNYLELKSELEAGGHKFCSHSDSEVLLHLYEDCSMEMLERIDGMFAFVIYNRCTKRLFAGRDRYGKKPFYYARTKSGFYYASEFRALASLVPDTLNEDAQAFYHYVTFNCFPREYTYYKEIRKLLPGHLLSVDALSQRVETRRYYQLQIHEGNDSPSQRDERLRLLFADAVKKRLMSDVPIGFFLSGGIDSSTMVAQAARFHSPVHTYSITLDDDPPEFDETPYARLVADRVGAIHHETRLSEREFVDNIEKVSWLVDEPVVLPDAGLLHVLTRSAANDGVKVLMSGDGADEVFFGYTGYWPPIQQYYERRLIYGLICPPFCSLAKKTLRRLAPDRFQRLQSLLLGRYRFFGENIGISDVQKNRNLSVRILNDPSVREWSEELSIRLQKANRTPHQLHLSKQLMLNEFNIRLPDLLLSRIDRVTMASSVETRNPYLDRALVEYATSIPFEDLFDGDKGKVALRRALKDLLPSEILKRGKMGFGASLAGRAKTGIVALHREVIAGTSFLADYYAPAYLSWLSSEEATKTFTGVHSSWNVITFALWKSRLDDLIRSAGGRSTSSPSQPEIHLEERA